MNSNGLASADASRRHRAGGPTDLSRVPRLSQRRSSHDAVRDGRGRFASLRCVNAHDRCYGGAGGPCPHCEIRGQGE